MGRVEANANGSQLHFQSEGFEVEGKKRPLNVTNEKTSRKIQRVGNDDGYTMWGLTKGSLLVGCKPKLRTCVVMGTSFPTWLLHTASLGFKVAKVIIQEPTHQESIFKICGSDVMVWSGKNWGKIISEWPMFEGEVVCFVDGRVSGGLLASLRSVGISDTFSTHAPRKPIHGWFTAAVRVQHEQVGGVTVGSVTIVHHSRASLAGLPLPLPVVVVRDAATVLTHSIFATFFRDPPKQVYPDPLECANLGSVGSPYYHGHGWLPAHLDTCVRVVTPVLNGASHGHKWGLRHISGAEAMLAKDVSLGHVKLLSARHRDNSFLLGLLPGKCLQIGYTLLVNGGVRTTDLQMT